MPDDDDDKTPITNWPQAFVVLGRQSIIGLLFFLFGAGVFTLFREREVMEDRHIGILLDRCLPSPTTSGPAP